MLRKVFLLPVLFFAFTLLSPDNVRAQLQGGFTFSDEGLKGFYIAVGDYFNVPQREIIIIREKRIRDEEIPVVLFISRRAAVPFLTVINLRLDGLSWLEISLRFGITPDVFYVPVRVVKGPPYGRAYGYYRNKPKHKWKAIVLSDDEIIDFVNLRFMSEHYGYPPEKVIRMRGEGKNFVVINDEIKKGEGKKPDGRGKKEGGRDEER